VRRERGGGESIFQGAKKKASERNLPKKKKRER
jgi:hypothetical protein